MRQLTRLTRSIDRTIETSIRPSVVSHICRTCRQSAAPFSTSSTRDDDQPKKPTSAFESLRKTIWGTDKPPGRENPYDPGSPMRQIEETESKPVRPGQAEATAETVAERKNDSNALEMGSKRANQRPSQDKYHPAKTWDGLEWVGTQEWVWKQQSIPKFEGHLRWDQKQQADDLQAALQKTLIEVVSQNKDSQTTVSAAKHDGELDLSNSVELGVDENNMLVLKQREVSKDGQVSENATTAWFNASIAKPGFKFQIAKSFLKATGIRISDFALNRCNTPGLLLKSIKQQLKITKKKKLAEILKDKSDLDELSNVKIVDRRITPIDKEKEIGRWKLVEDELLARGLPVTGRPVVQ